MEQTTRQLLKENKLHGNKTFPLAIYWMKQLGGDIPIVDCHWHKEVEFFYCIEGEVLFQINQEYIHVKQGEAIFIDSEELHTGHSINHSNCTFAAIVLDTTLLDSAQLDVIQTQYIAPFHEKRRSFPRHFSSSIGWHNQILFYIKQILDSYEQHVLGYELIIKANLLLMLQQCYNHQATVNRTSLTNNSDTQMEKLKRVISFIHTNYNRPLSLHELAQLIPMSEGHFCRFFKKMTRQTVTEFINSYRIKQAATLLSETEMKISSIAYEVGFEHISYFIKLFKHHFNCSPSSYRRQKY